MIFWVPSRQDLGWTWSNMQQKESDLNHIDFLVTLFVPRAGARKLVAIVYSWWLLKDLSIKWLKYSLGVFK